MRPGSRARGHTLAAGHAALAYEVLPGPRDAESLVMIQGLGMQLIDWPDPLVAHLARSRRIVLFDNRDSGLSSTFGPPREPDALRRAAALFDGAYEPQSYTLFDMADDVVRLMDHLDLASAHLLGFSMGGMVAQIVAALHPARVRTLTSLMSAGGEPWFDCTPEIRAALIRSMVGFPSLDDAVTDSVAAAPLYGVRARGQSASDLAAHARRSFTRAYRPGGVLRQANAIRASGDRAELLRRISAATNVIHGLQDDCIPPRQAVRAAHLIAGSRLHLLPGVGHDLHDLTDLELVSPEHAPD